MEESIVYVFEEPVVEYDLVESHFVIQEPQTYDLELTQIADTMNSNSSQDSTGKNDAPLLVTDEDNIVHENVVQSPLTQQTSKAEDSEESVNNFNNEIVVNTCTSELTSDSSLKTSNLSYNVHSVSQSNDSDSLESNLLSISIPVEENKQVQSIESNENENSSSISLEKVQSLYGEDDPVANTFVATVPTENELMKTPEIKSATQIDDTTLYFSPISSASSASNSILLKTPTSMLPSVLNRNKISPIKKPVELNTSVEKNSPISDTSSPISGVRTSVLGKEQIKKRLQSFSLLKQGIQPIPIKKILTANKAPKVQVQIGDVYDETGNKLEDKIVIIKKPPKQGPSPQEKARAVIDEIEQIKREEAAIYEQNLTFMTNSMRDALKKSKSAAHDIEDKHTDKRDKKYDKDYSKNRRRRSLENEKFEKKRSDKPSDKPKEEMPQDWREMKRKDIGFKKISKIKEKSFKFSEDVHPDRNDKKGHKRFQDEEKPCSYKREDYVKPQILFEFPSLPRHPLVAMSVQGKSKSYPPEMIRFTEKYPQISYCENPLRSTDVFKTRKQVLNEVPAEISEVMMQIIENKTGINQNISGTSFNGSWYPSKDYIVESKINNAEPTKSYGLAVLSEMYNDDQEENHDEQTERPEDEKGKKESGKKREKKKSKKKDKKRNKKHKSKSKSRSKSKEKSNQEKQEGGDGKKSDNSKKSSKEKPTKNKSQDEDKEETKSPQKVEDEKEQHEDNTPNTDEYRSNWESDEDILNIIRVETEDTSSYNKLYHRSNSLDKNWESEEETHNNQTTNRRQSENKSSDKKKLEPSSSEERSRRKSDDDKRKYKHTYTIDDKPPDFDEKHTQSSKKLINLDEKIECDNRRSLHSQERHSSEIDHKKSKDSNRELEEKFRYSEERIDHKRSKDFRNEIDRKNESDDKTYDHKKSHYYPENKRHSSDFDHKKGKEFSRDVENKNEYETNKKSKERSSQFSSHDISYQSGYDSRPSKDENKFRESKEKSSRFSSEEKTHQSFEFESRRSKDDNKAKESKERSSELDSRRLKDDNKLKEISRFSSEEKAHQLPEFDHRKSKDESKSKDRPTRFSTEENVHRTSEIDSRRPKEDNKFKELKESSRFSSDEKAHHEFDPKRSNEDNKIKERSRYSSEEKIPKISEFDSRRSKEDNKFKDVKERSRFSSEEKAHHSSEFDSRRTKEDNKFKDVKEISRFSSEEKVHHSSEFNSRRTKEDNKLKDVQERSGFSSEEKNISSEFDSRRSKEKKFKERSRFSSEEKARNSAEFETRRSKDDHRSKESKERSSRYSSQEILHHPVEFDNKRLKDDNKPKELKEKSSRYQSEEVSNQASEFDYRRSKDDNKSKELIEKPTRLSSHESFDLDSRRTKDDNKSKESKDRSFRLSFEDISHPPIDFDDRRSKEDNKFNEKPSRHISEEKKGLHSLEYDHRRPKEIEEKIEFGDNKKVKEKSRSEDKTKSSEFESKQSKYVESKNRTENRPKVRHEFDEKNSEHNHGKSNEPTCVPIKLREEEDKIRNASEEKSQHSTRSRDSKHEVDLQPKRSITLKLDLEEPIRVIEEKSRRLSENMFYNKWSSEEDINKESKRKSVSENRKLPEKNSKHIEQALNDNYRRSQWSSDDEFEKIAGKINRNQDDLLFLDKKKRKSRWEEPPEGRYRDIDDIFEKSQNDFFNFTKDFQRNRKITEELLSQRDYGKEDSKKNKKSKKLSKEEKRREKLEEKLKIKDKKSKKKSKDKKMKIKDKKLKDKRPKVTITYSDMEDNFEEEFISKKEKESHVELELFKTSTECFSKYVPKIKIDYSDFDMSLIESKDKYNKKFGDSVVQQITTSENSPDSTKQETHTQLNISEIIKDEPISIPQNLKVSKVEDIKITDNVEKEIVLDVSPIQEEAILPISEKELEKSPELLQPEVDIPAAVTEHVTPVLVQPVIPLPEISPVAPPALPIPKPVIETETNATEDTSSKLASEYEEFMKAVCFDEPKDEADETLPIESILKETVKEKDKLEPEIPEKNDTSEVEVISEKLKTKDISESEDSSLETSSAGESSDDEHSDTSIESSASESLSPNSEKNKIILDTVAKIKTEIVTDSENEYSDKEHDQSDNKRKRSDTSESGSDNDYANVVVKKEKDSSKKQKKIIPEISPFESNADKYDNIIDWEKTYPTNTSVDMYLNIDNSVEKLQPSRKYSIIDVSEIMTPTMLPENIPLPSEVDFSIQDIPTPDFSQHQLQSPKETISTPHSDCQTPSPVKKSRSFIPIKLLTAESRKQANETANLVTPERATSFGKVKDLLTQEEILEKPIVISSSDTSNTESIATPGRIIENIDDQEQQNQSRKRQSQWNMNLTPAKKPLLQTSALGEVDSDEDFTDKFIKQSEDKKKEHLKKPDDTINKDALKSEFAENKKSDIPRLSKDLPDDKSRSFDKSKEKSTRPSPDRKHDKATDLQQKTDRRSSSIPKSDKRTSRRFSREKDRKDTRQDNSIDRKRERSREKFNNSKESQRDREKRRQSDRRVPERKPLLPTKGRSRYSREKDTPRSRGRERDRSKEKPKLDRIKDREIRDSMDRTRDRDIRDSLDHSRDRDIRDMDHLNRGRDRDVRDSLDRGREREFRDADHLDRGRERDVRDSLDRGREREFRDSDHLDRGRDRDRIIRDPNLERGRERDSRDLDHLDRGRERDPRDLDHLDRGRERDPRDIDHLDRGREQDPRDLDHLDRGRERDPRDLEHLDRGRDRDIRDSVHLDRNRDRDIRDVDPLDRGRDRDIRDSDLDRVKERDLDRGRDRDPRDSRSYRRDDTRKYSRSPSPNRKNYRYPIGTIPPHRLDDTDFSATSMDIVQSPVNSPLDGFKRSLADSTISDSELITQMNTPDESSEPSPGYIQQHPHQKYYPHLPQLSTSATESTASPCSPKRISLDDRINLVLGLEKEPPKQIDTVCTRGPYSNNANNPTPSYHDPYGYGRSEYEVYNATAADGYMQGPYPGQYHQTPYYQNQMTGDNNVKVVQVGNVIQVVPTDQPPALPPNIIPVPKATEVPPKVVQVGNMLQIVPMTIIETAAVVSPVIAVAPSIPVVEKPVVITKATDQLMQERRAEKEKRRQEREQRRKEKEKKRKEKEKRRQLKIKLKTENMIKRALLLETGEGELDISNIENEPAIEPTTDNNLPTAWPPTSVGASVPLPKPPAKGILVSHGFREKDDSNSDEVAEPRKAVKFADGICPGEGTSPSGGEELPSPPPPPRKLPKEKRYKKTKNKNKKKIKVKIIRTQQPPTDDDDDSEDTLPPPPPPPGSPPPHLWPPRIKQPPVNNIHPSLPTAVFPPPVYSTPPPQQVMYPPAFPPQQMPVVMGHAPPPPPPQGPPIRHHHPPVMPVLPGGGGVPPPLSHHGAHHGAPPFLH